VGREAIENMDAAQLLLREELVHPGGRTVGLQAITDYLTQRHVTGSSPDA
jgi:hypothetical protein